MPKPKLIALYSWYILIFSLPLTSLGQHHHHSDDPVEFTFFSNGRYKVYAPEKVLPKDVKITIDNDKDKVHPFVFTFQYDKSGHSFNALSIPAAIQLADSDLKKINKQLAARMTLALDDIADSPSLQRLYANFFGEPDWAAAKTELASLSKALEENKFDLHNCGIDYPHLAGFCSLEDSLTSPYPPYSVNVTLNTDSSKYDIFVSKTDWFRECLRKYWVNTIQKTSFNDQKIDHGYKAAWKQLEQVAGRILAFYEQLPKDTPMACAGFDKRDDYVSAFSRFKDTLDKVAANPVLQLIRKNLTFYRNNFWYNYGFFGINPLGYSTPDRSYKVLLYQKDAAMRHDSIVLDKLRQAKNCCTLSMNGVDSLIRLINSGEKVFSTDTTVVDPIWGINTLSLLRKSRKVLNDFQSPVTFNCFRPQLTLQFDAARHYAADPHNRIYKSVASSDSVNFTFYNITSGTLVNLTQIPQPTTNTSDLEDFFASLSASGLITAAGQLSTGVFNQQPTPFVNLAAGPANLGVTSPPLDWIKQRANGNAISLADSTDHHLTFPITPGMSDSDILIMYLQAVHPELYDQRFINDFFRCHVNTPKVTDTYRGQNKLIAHVDALVNAYQAFLTRNKQLADNLHQAAHVLTVHRWLTDLATITDRSLPPLPADLGGQVDSTPTFRSQIFPVPLKDSTRGIQASIVEKKVNKKDTITTIYPINPGLRIGKKLFITLSAGIEVTPGAYYQKSASIVNNQLVVTNNATTVGYEVGLNYYPAGLFQIDNSFLGLGRNRLKNRLFFFAGVGLPNPTKDYFLGFGADLVPGLKLMTGAHLYLNTNYQIINDQIAAQANGVEFAGPYIAVNLDPAALINFLNLFK